MLIKGLPEAKPDMTPEAVASLLLYLGPEAPVAMSSSAVDLFGLCLGLPRTRMPMIHAQPILFPRNPKNKDQ